MPTQSDFQSGYYFGVLLAVPICPLVILSSFLHIAKRTWWKYIEHGSSAPNPPVTPFHSNSKAFQDCSVDHFHSLLQTMYGHSLFLNGMSLCCTGPWISTWLSLSCHLLDCFIQRKGWPPHSWLANHHHLFTLHCTILPLECMKQQETDLARFNHGQNPRARWYLKQNSHSISTGQMNRSYGIL
jgi:hypothetical protein